jgi:hypothetical protein
MVKRPAAQKISGAKFSEWQRVVIKAKTSSGQTKKKNLSRKHQKILLPARGFGFIPPCRHRPTQPTAAG